MMEREKTDLFLSVVESHKGIIYKVANAYCKEEEDRKDLIQEIFIQLWKSFDKYNRQFAYSTWFYRIALNVAISFYRKEKRRQETHDSLDDSILNISESGHNQLLESKMEDLQQFITELSALDKALILLYFDERSHKEMAEIMGISETNVATKISRIKNALRKKFEHLKNQ